MSCQGGDGERVEGGGGRGEGEEKEEEEGEGGEEEKGEREGGKRGCEVDGGSGRRKEGESE